MNETETQLRLRKAEQHLAFCREAANEARRILAQANEDIAKAKEKYEAAFAANEKSVCDKLRNEYMHCTK